MNFIFELFAEQVSCIGHSFYSDSRTKPIDAAPYSKSVILTSLGRKFPNAMLRGFKVGYIFVLFVSVLDLMGASEVFVCL